MVDRACLEKALTAAGKDFSPKEMEKLLEQLENRIKKKIAGRAGVRETLDVHVLEDAAALADEVTMEKMIQKRQALINIVAGRYRADIFAQLPHDPAAAITAMNVGLNNPIKGGRNAVDTRQKAAFVGFMGTMVSELRKANVLEFFKTADKEMERNIGREMEQLNRKGGTPGITKNPEAQKIAKIINEVQESSRVMQNDAGAFIRKREGWVAPQSHDMGAIYRAGWTAKDYAPMKTKAELDARFERSFDTWHKDITSFGLDPFMFRDVDENGEYKYLRGLYYAFISGEHLKTLGAEPMVAEGAPGGGTNRAAKASESREILFKDFDGWYNYNLKYGSGSLRNSIVSGLRHAADNIGVMQVWGTNPRRAFEQTLKDLREQYRGNPKAHSALKSQALENQFDVVDGTANIPGSPNLAAIGAGSRALTSMSKLGMAVVSSIADIATVGGEMKYQTGSFLRGHKLALESRFQAVPDHLRAETSDLCGAGLDGILGDIHQKFDGGDTLPGLFSKAMEKFFKLNLMSWWDDSFRRGWANTAARELAFHAPKGHAEITPDLQRTLGLFGIGEKEWDLYRQHVKEAGDGREYITPDVVKHISDDKIAAYIGKERAPEYKQVTRNDATAQRFKEGQMNLWKRQATRAFDDLTEPFRKVLDALGVDEKAWDKYRGEDAAGGVRKYLDNSIIKKLDNEKIFNHLDDKAVVTAAGEITPGQLRRARADLEQKLRMYFVDRSEYAILKPSDRERAIMYQGLKPGTPMGEITRFFWQFKSFSTAFITKAWGREMYGKGAPGWNMSGARGIVSLMLTSTALGYLSMTIKDTLKGRVPRPPTDAKTWVAAMQQGGGLGIYGDYLFGDYNRSGNSFWATALGPTAGNVEDVVKLWSAALHGDDTAAKTLRLVQSNLPFANLFYLRPAMDYLFFYDLQEAVNPGSLRRMERKMQKENDQTMYVPPSQVRAHPFTR